MNFDFTLNKYSHFCETLKNLACPILAVEDYVARNHPNGFSIILRHDVDRLLPAAIRMARLEAEHDIRASYYIRMTPGVFKPAALEQLSDLGHEIGYHYEVLTKAKGNLAKAIKIFESELKALREIAPITTISMHGSPFSRWNNLSLWDTYDFNDYDLNAEISLSIDYANSYYFTDTGRSWNANRFNLRDRVNSKETSEAVKTTDQLMGFVSRKYASPVFINVHPNRWAATPADFLISGMQDWIANMAKWLFSISNN